MVANEEDYDIQQSQAKPNMGFGNYFEFAKERSSGRLGAGLGAGIGIWNLEFGDFEFARSAGGRDWNLESGNFEFARGPGGRDWNLESGNFEFARGPWGGWDVQQVAPPHPLSAAP